MTINIPRLILGELIFNALKEDPRESCGFLLGNGHVVDDMHAMTNIDDKPISRYTMQPAELLDVQDKLDRTNREFVAIYHSHTFTQGYPSTTDIKNAGLVNHISNRHVIISLVEKTRPVVRAFNISITEEVTELLIKTDGATYVVYD